jgi:hypothetical protein
MTVVRLLLLTAWILQTGAAAARARKKGSLLTGKKITEKFQQARDTMPLNTIETQSDFSLHYVHM